VGKHGPDQRTGDRQAQQWQWQHWQWQVEWLWQLDSGLVAVAVVI
jgi:hypothetical protein